MSFSIHDDEIARGDDEHSPAQLFARYDIVKLVDVVRELAFASQSETTSRLRNLAKEALNWPQFKI